MKKSISGESAYFCRHIVYTVLPFIQKKRRWIIHMLAKRSVHAPVDQEGEVEHCLQATPGRFLPRQHEE